MCFWYVKSFKHDNLTVKHCYLICSKPPGVGSIYCFDNDDQATKHYEKYSFQPYHLHQNFDPIYQEALCTGNNNVLQ